MEDIYLRPLRIEDAWTSYKWRNDPRVWVYTGSRPTCNVTIEMEEAWMRKVLNEDNSRRFAICLRETDRYVGNAYLINIDRNRKSCELGIFIGDVSMWGRGIGTQANLKLKGIAAQDLGLCEVVGRIRVKHKGSLKAALRAGLVERQRDAEWVILGKRLEIT